MRFVTLTLLVLQTIFILVLLSLLDKHIFTFNDVRDSYYYGCLRGLVISEKNVTKASTCNKDASYWQEILEKLINE
jgi:hypothetical protein